MYAYEALGATRFQELCAALIYDKFPNARAYPTGQKDGGRDVTAHGGEMVFQVKFTQKKPPKLLTWVESQVREESKHFERLKSEGCSSYRLMTNIAATAAPGVGEMDRVRSALERLGQKHGLELDVVWRADLDSWVRSASGGIRLGFAEMLVGTEALVALLKSNNLRDSEERQRDLIRDYVSTCWTLERQVKFAQIELVSNSISALFTDVSAKRMSRPPDTRSANGEHEADIAKYLLDDPNPYVLIEGTPGQGKSTITQYVCQAHRAAIRHPSGVSGSEEDVPDLRPKEPRVPIRIDLSEYAYWLSGGDPWSTSPPKSKRSGRKKADLESFLAGHIDATVPDQHVSPATVRHLLSHIAVVLVLDGLDEVASIAMRERVVAEIDAFIGRAADTETADIRVIVTTRPDASGLARPTRLPSEDFSLSPLTSDQRKRLMRRWAKAQKLPARDLRLIERVFDERTAAPHVVQLADNPMQLTLLLHLIRIKGDALPEQRTALYRQYMDLYMSREVAKAEVVRANRPDIEESTAYMGWYMHGSAEVDPSSNRLDEDRIVKVMERYLAAAGRPNVPVREVFEAMKDRVWVLTSKVTGTYEFDIQSIQEFCAAQFLFDFVDASQDYAPEDAVHHLLDDPYWTNVVRFLAGHFNKRELPALGVSILDRLETKPGLRQALSTCWLLLADGVFVRQERTQESLAHRLAEAVPLRLIGTLGIAQSAPLGPTSGGRSLSLRLNGEIARVRRSPLNTLRADISCQAGGIDQFRTWWEREVRRANTSEELESVLRLGSLYSLGSDLEETVVEDLGISNVPVAVAAAACGVAPKEGSAQSQAMLDAALDGHLTDLRLAGSSHAVDLVRVVDPMQFLGFVRGERIPSSPDRTSALKRLQSRLPQHGQALQKAIRVGKNQGKTTSRWVNTAIALTEAYGRSTWLATEIAVIGASAPSEEFRVGGDRMAGRPLIGSGMDFGAWVPEVRSNRDNESWWRSCALDCSDDHARATWLISLLSVGGPHVVRALTDTVQEFTSQISFDALSALLSTAERIGSRDWIRNIDLPTSTDWSPPARLLISHFADAPTRILGRDLEDLLRMSDYAGSERAVAAANRLVLADPTEARLSLLAGLGVRYGGPLPRGDLPHEVAERILDGHLVLNDQWLLRAEEQVSSARAHHPFRTVAEQRWLLP